MLRDTLARFAVLSAAVVRQRARLVPLLLLVGTGGCFATRGDVRVLQGDIATMRTDLLRNQQEQKDALAKVAASLQVVSDSLAKVSARTVSVQGDASGNMRAILDRLQQMQTLIGQNQATIARMRADMEARTNDLVAAARAAQQGAVPPAGASTPSGSAPGSTPLNPPTTSGGAPGTITNPAGSTRPPADTSASSGNQPGPNQLYTTGMNLLTRGSTATARATLQELLLTYPQFDLAPDAQFYIAESLAREKNVAAAETAYAAVVATYPTSNVAPRALFKRGLLMLEQGNTAQAKQLLEQVVSKYPRSDEAVLAAERLKTIR